MKTSNATPRSLKGLVSLGVKVLAGAEAVGEDVELGQNTAPRVAADLYDLTGNPATPHLPGKQALYAAQKTVLTQAYAAQQAAIAAGREFCRLTIGILKTVLGSRWNWRWNAAGFTSPTLALPTDPVPMLLQFREYFKTNPAREVAALGVTSANAYALVLAIQSANSATAQARDLRLQRKRARDAAQKKLRARLSGMRAELDQVLADDDGRWFDFGFRRPADGRKPAPVEEVSVKRIGPAAVLVSWPPSARAESYRVAYRIKNSDAPPVQLGLFTETQCTITDLPHEAELEVIITARNAAGETSG